ncbi:MAG: hypothetical protein C0471_02470 [Erythrobacter sp.]|nr:hypothetical protein [Erythrobacter sp.]
MTEKRLWIALVTFERRDEKQHMLPEWAHGACGWMVAVAQDEEAARGLLVRDVESQGFRVLAIEDEREVFGDDEIEEVDDHLAMNFRVIEPRKQTVWGTIHGYMGEGEA